eukprot:COSAG03_NODE_33_length_18025_cov_70.016903_12_plen_497_part_00
MPGMAQLLLLQIVTTAAERAGPVHVSGVNVTRLNISSFDGTRLPAVLMVPTTATREVPAAWPGLIMSNSWFIDSDVEYYTVQHAWAGLGIASLSYESRGWDGAGGMIAMAGQVDWRDHRAVVDVLAAQQGVNASALGTLGVSLGAGLAVLGAAHDSRIKFAVSLSGWGNLTTALYGGDTASAQWGSLLVSSGNKTGHESSALKMRWQELLHHKNLSSVSRWSDTRSPLNYTEALCGSGRQLPIFISNNAEDRLFKPDAALYYREKLLAAGCRVHTMVNQGIHATAEIPALLNESRVEKSPVWSTVLRWLEQWLVNGAIVRQDRPSMQMRRHSLLEPQPPYVELPRVIHSRFELLGRKNGAEDVFGRLRRHSLTPPAPISSPSQTLRYAPENVSGLSAGVPFAGEIMQYYSDVPILVPLDKINADYAAVFLSDQLSPDARRLCGTPRVNLRVSAEAPRSLSASTFTIIAYLYDVPPAGYLGTLLTHGPQSEWGTDPR